MLRKEEVIQRLAAHRQELVRFGVKSLALSARDEARPTSDVDLLVEFEGRATFDQYMDLKLYLEQLLGCPVDLVTREAASAPYGGRRGAVCHVTRNSTWMTFAKLVRGLCATRRV
jgi:predicted nucleotidyltransferase